VVWNSFLEIDPIFEDGDGTSIGFSQDLLQLKNLKYFVLIDLGWYPDHDPTGRYLLRAIRIYPSVDEMKRSWDKPLMVMESASKMEIVQAIEIWLSQSATLFK